MEVVTTGHIEELKEELSSYDIQISDGQASLLLKHLELVIEKNKVINLTRIVSVEEGISKHIVDSLLLTKFMSNETPDTKVAKEELQKEFLDIGSGAGYPGIPLATVTGMKGTLIDSVGKKVNAMNEFLEELEISNSVAHHMRAEEMAKSKKNSFDYVVARAVAETAILMEYASPLLKIGGSLIITKAVPTDEEISHAKMVEKKLGFELVSRETFTLPHDFGKRTLFKYSKMKSASVKLPRNVGMAKHHPLYEE